MAHAERVVLYSRGESWHLWSVKLGEHTRLRLLCSVHVAAEAHAPVHSTHQIILSPRVNSPAPRAPGQQGGLQHSTQVRYVGTFLPSTSLCAVHYCLLRCGHALPPCPLALGVASLATEPSRPICVPIPSVYQKMADTPLAHLFDSLDRTEGVDHPLYISLRYCASVLCAYVGVYVHAWVAPCRPEAFEVNHYYCCM